MAYNVQEATRLAVGFIVAAVALDRLDANPDVMKILMTDLREIESRPPRPPSPTCSKQPSNGQKLGQ